MNVTERDDTYPEALLRAQRDAAFRRLSSEAVRECIREGTRATVHLAVDSTSRANSRQREPNLTD